MKRFLISILTVTLLLALVVPLQAWQVNIKNSCKHKISFLVHGDHPMQWPAVCAVNVNSGETRSCYLPEAICPKWIEAGYTYYGNQANLPKVDNSPCYCTNRKAACCWNVRLEATSDGDNCKLSIVNLQH